MFHYRKWLPIGIYLNGFAIHFMGISLLAFVTTIDARRKTGWKKTERRTLYELKKVLKMVKQRILYEY